jgi:3-deoxy-manno-octulosonate cytidylyltransferase (CMP-KDO synthetase)
MSNYVIIPARLESTRLPRKLLKNDTGHPLIWHTVQNAKQSKVATSIIVATDSEEIRDAIKDEAEVVMTGECSSGTERVSEACRKLDLNGNIVNLQGDEPEVDMFCVDELFQLLDSRTEHCWWNVATLATKASHSEYIDPNVAKVVLGTGGQAMYFSRSPIPHGGWEQSLKHIGVYAYSSVFVRGLCLLNDTNTINASENLEQLRWMENGFPIKALVRDIQTTGIDTQEDYERFVNEYTKASR